MKKHIYTILIFCILSITSYKSFADHISGAEITYACTGTANVYTITFTFYRQCQGIALCPEVCGGTCTISGCQIIGADPACNGTVFGTFNLSLTSVSDLKDELCPSVKNVCTNMGCETAGTFTPGLEKYVFQGNVDLSTFSIPSSCCNVRIVYASCCRSAEIVTGQTWQSYYTEAIINRCVTPCNNSPVFANEPYYIVCKGNSYIYNNGAVDPDHDSLTYAFTPALQAVSSSCTYSSPFSYDAPMPYSGTSKSSPFPNGIHCDALTGDIMFTPPSTTSNNFVGIVAIEIKQWRNISGVQTAVGVTRREIQTYILTSSPNTYPTFTTYPSDTGSFPKYKWTGCAGQQMCFTIAAQDSDAADTTYLTWDNSISSLGATLTPLYTDSLRSSNGPRQDSMQFCWTPSTSMISSLPYYFSIKARDNKCSIRGLIARNFSIKVIGPPSAVLHKSQSCYKWNLSYTTTAGSPIISSRQWQISKTQGAFDTSNYTSFTSATVNNFSFADTGKFVVKLILTGDTACSLTTIIYDTLYNSTVFKLTPLLDTLFCSGPTIKLKAIHSGGASPFTIKWYDAASSSTILSTNDSLIITPTTSKNYVYKITDYAGCVLLDTSAVKVNPMPVSTLPISMRVCSGTSYTLNPGGATTPNLKYLWSTGDTTKTITRNDSNTFWVRITDTTGCRIFDTMALYVSPAVYTHAGNDTTICLGQKIVLRATGASLYRWYAIPSLTPLNFIDTIVVSPATQTYYRLFSGVSCAIADTVKVSVNTLPILTMPSQQNICESTAPTFQIPNVTSTKPGGIGIWSYISIPTAVSSSGLITVNLLSSQPASPSWIANNYISYQYTDTQGCVSKDSSIVSLHNTPLVNAGSDHSFCSYDSLYNITTAQSATPAGGIWNGKTVYLQSSNYYFKPYLANKYPQTNALIYSYVQSFSGGLNCLNTDTTFFVVYGKPSTSSITGNATSSKNASEPYNVNYTLGSNYNWWVTNGTQTSGGNTNSIMVKWGSVNSGKVSVQETSNNNCKGDTVKLTVTLSSAGIEENKIFDKLNIYPNPTDGLLTIEFETAEKNVDLEVFDVSGKLVLQSLSKHNGGLFQKSLDLSHLSEGNYFVKITAGEKSTTVKVTLK